MVEQEADGVLTGTLGKEMGDLGRRLPFPFGSTRPRSRLCHSFPSISDPELPPGNEWKAPHQEGKTVQEPQRGRLLSPPASRSTNLDPEQDSATGHPRKGEMAT